MYGKNTNVNWDKGIKGEEKNYSNGDGLMNVIVVYMRSSTTISLGRVCNKTEAEQRGKRKENKISKHCWAMLAGREQKAVVTTRTTNDAIYPAYNKRIFSALDRWEPAQHNMCTLDFLSQLSADHRSHRRICLFTVCVLSAVAHAR